MTEDNGNDNDDSGGVDGTDERDDDSGVGIKDITTILIDGSDR